jgi:hypothetical protein
MAWRIALAIGSSVWRYWSIKIFIIRMLEEMLALAASEGMVQDKISEHYRSLIASDNLFVGNRLGDICISDIFNEKK